MTKYLALIAEIERGRDLKTVVGRLVMHTQSCPTCGVPAHYRCLSLGNSEPIDAVHAARAKKLANELRKEMLDVTTDG